MLGVRGANADSLDAGIADHFLGVVEGLGVVFVGEGAGFLEVAAADGDEFGLGHGFEAGGKDVADLAAADECCFEFVQRCLRV